MGQTKAFQPKERLPSFSIVLETENLANAEINKLSESLNSLVNQDLSPTQANEVLLIDSGDVPPQKLEQLRQKYPWIKVYQAPSGTGYYQAKMLGANLVTGEIVVYCDSDCIYETNWLRNLLIPFTQSDEIQIVAGETTTQARGIYGTAMALTYIFPQYSQQKTLQPTSQYFLNNVAFRREFLLQYPIPTELVLYRGNCVIHAHTLRSLGYTIWRQPQARATHAPPSGLSHFFWRFLLIGHDYYWQNRLLAKFQQKYRDPTAGLQSKLQILCKRLSKMFTNQPIHIIYLPLAIPIVITSVVLVFIGYVITLFQPHYLLKVYNQILGEFEAA
ncbi:glycosyl transferase family 2 [Fischerella thermalis CCMEE 5330]|uniref:Glycosyl transferase family 2 n=1 Tax=Fischerella thermalis CCMEE 5330 TaxID=2019670 RepID=A0A2N6LZ00_9CYAN|nr:glycosyltransferase [Fischerella thermalis]PMB39708.1 glycosyl transferase family 2 [Fischerella thermalis CCMEE 5330]